MGLTLCASGCERRRDQRPAEPRGRLSAGRWVCQEFLEKVRAKQLDAAYDLLHPEVRQQLNRGAFEQRLAQFPPLVEHDDLFFFETGELRQAGVLSRGKRKVRFTCFNEAFDTAQPDYNILGLEVGGMPVFGLGVAPPAPTASAR